MKTHEIKALEYISKVQKFIDSGRLTSLEIPAQTQFTILVFDASVDSSFKLYTPIHLPTISVYFYSSPITLNELQGRINIGVFGKVDLYNRTTLLNSAKITLRRAENSGMITSLVLDRK